MIGFLYFLMMLFQHVLTMDNLQLLVIVPLNSSGSRAGNGWERGLELLEGAERAVQVINNDTQILQNHTLEMVVINSVTCSSKQYKGIILPQLLNETVHGILHNVIGAVGMFCPDTAKLVIELEKNNRNTLKFPVFIGSLVHRLYEAELPPNLNFMFDSSSAIVKALVKFMEYQQWTRLAVITDSDDTYYFQTADIFLKSTKPHEDISVSIYYYKLGGLHNLVDAEVIFISASFNILTEVIQKAIESKWVWPTHALIFHTHTIDDIVAHSKQIQSVSSLNGMFFFQYSKKPTISAFEPIYPGIGTYCSSANIYSSIMCESIIICSLLKNRSLAELGLVGSEYKRTRTLFSSGIDLIHISSGQPFLVGHYNTHLGSLTIVNHSVLNSKIQGHSSTSTLVVVAFSTEIVISFTLVTVNLILYIYYRKEPEVKATSYMITMIIFAACYLLILYLVLLGSEQVYVTMSTDLITAVCLVRSWINLFGVPGPLILATVLVKMLRVYKIFHPNNFTRMGKWLSDPAVLCYILVLQVPNVMVALLWSILDPYKNQKNPEVQYVCYSNNIVLWTMTLLGYFILLNIALIAVAIKTRKIRKMHFKDTKKVNLFVYIMMFLMTFLLSMWLISRALINILDAKLILHFGHAFLILITQCLLIVPKVYPPFRRHTQKIKQKRGPLQTAVSSDNGTTKATHNYVLFEKQQASKCSEFTLCDY